ncbi:unnamed protein product, partial [Prorocentrum cordatum]
GLGEGGSQQSKPDDQAVGSTGSNFNDLLRAELGSAASQSAAPSSATAPPVDLDAELAAMFHRAFGEGQANCSDPQEEQTEQEDGDPPALGLKHKKDINLEECARNSFQLAMKSPVGKRFYIWLCSHMGDKAKCDAMSTDGQAQRRAEWAKKKCDVYSSHRTKVTRTTTQRAKKGQMMNRDQIIAAEGGRGSPSAAKGAIRIAGWCTKRGAEFCEINERSGRVMFDYERETRMDAEITNWDDHEEERDSENMAAQEEKKGLDTPMKQTVIGAPAASGAVGASPGEPADQSKPQTSGGQQAVVSRGGKNKQGRRGAGAKNETEKIKQATEIVNQYSLTVMKSDSLLHKIAQQKEGRGKFEAFKGDFETALAKLKQ